MTKAIIFTGPSLHPDKAKEIFREAEYRPPVARGDVIRALREGARIIGIIDGVFMQTLAVAHREILAALDEGVIVVGGSSMGALRATELDIYGMIGVGTIYRWYKMGHITSDDEVALIFDPTTFESSSEPLVNIRVNLKILVEKGILSEVKAKRLLSVAQSIYFPNRTYAKVISESVKLNLIDNGEASKVLSFLRCHKRDLKMEDALEVVNTVKSYATKLETSNTSE